MFGQGSVRPAAVAGAFYPADPQELAATVDDLLAQAPPAEKTSRVILAPHAGYVYSGPTAAAAYRALDPGLKRVVVLGPTHYVGIAGMALTGADWQETPLGAVRTDPDLTATLEAFPEVITAPVVHAREHAIEVQLPFLQRHLGPDVTVVPVAVGQTDPAAVARVIETALADPETGVVISSDLSHYLPYEAAQLRDGATLQQIEQGAPPLSPEQACGAFPTSGMMRFAQDNGWQARVLDACNSGDTAGKGTRNEGGVVGYAALAWEPPASEDPAEESAGQEESADLPTLAYRAIDAAISPGGINSGANGARLPGVGAQDVGVGVPGLQEPGAAFVTLTLDGRLRGCIGTLEARRPLGEDVAVNAVKAALEDPRFPPLTREELGRVDVEVSVLSEPAPMIPEGTGLSEEEVLRRLRPGIDGVTLRLGTRRATFLPEVWYQLPIPEEFLGELKRKAGLPASYWNDQIQIDTYTATSHRLHRPPEDSPPEDVPPEDFPVDSSGGGSG